MNELIELVEVLNFQKIRQVELLTNRNNSQTKGKELYDLIRSGKVTSDQEAQLALYGEVTTNTSSSYRKLKSRLTRQLENTLFHIELNKAPENEYANALIEIQKCWSKVVILLGKYARRKGIQLAKKGLRLSEKYEVTNMVILFAGTLATHYSYNEPKPTYLLYNEKVDRSLEILTHEIRATRYYNKISRIYSTSKFPSTSKILQLLESQTTDLKTMVDKYGTLTINWYYYELVTFQETLKKDYRKAYQLAIEGLSYLKLKPFKIRAIEFNLRSNLIHALLNLKKYDDVRVQIEKNLNMLPDRGNPWLSTKNLEFHWAVYCKKYNLLPSIVSETLSTKAIRSRPLHLQQWKIKEAYISFLFHIGWIKSDDSTPAPKFRAGKFINELPTFSKDKKGLNISILVIQLLFLLAKKKYSKVIDRVDALKQYNYRYLREDDMYRASCFIKMLLKIPMHNFHPVAIRRHTKKLEKTLNQNSVHLNQASMEVEIIPYEILWEATLQILQNHKEKGHSMAK